MNQIPGLARAGQPHYARGSRLITWPTFWREAIDSSLSLRREVKCWHIDGQRCPLVNKTMTSRQKLYLSRTKTTNGVVWPSIVENYRTLTSLSGKAACSRQLLSMFEWRCLFTLEVNIAIDTDKSIYTVPLQLLESRCCSCCMKIEEYSGVIEILLSVGHCQFLKYDVSPLWLASTYNKNMLHGFTFSIHVYETSLDQVI